MKGLIKILLGAFAVFMVLAVGQEWEFFSSAWFGAGPKTPVLSEEDRRGASEAVRAALTLMSHIYASSGDPRFVDRIPASEGILEEILADVRYLTRNRRYQEMHLDSFKVISIEAREEGHAEVRTQETWTVRTLWIDGTGESDPPVSFSCAGKYLVARGGKGWRVEGWDILEETSSTEGAPS